MAEDVFERLRRVTFEGEHIERMAALNVRMKLSPGADQNPHAALPAEDGDVHGGDGPGHRRATRPMPPRWSTTLTPTGLARREPRPDDRRVKIVVLTDAGRTLAGEINAVLSVPPPPSVRSARRSCVSCVISSTRSWRLVTTRPPSPASTRRSWPRPPRPRPPRPPRPRPVPPPSPHRRRPPRTPEERGAVPLSAPTIESR